MDLVQQFTPGTKQGLDRTVWKGHYENVKQRVLLLLLLLLQPQLQLLLLLLRKRHQWLRYEKGSWPVSLGLRFRASAC